MSSVGAVQMASTNDQKGVRDRRILWSGGVVALKISATAKLGHYPNDGEEVPFLQIPRYVRGGRVNIFVHSGDLSLRGSTIVAEVFIMKKTLGNGYEYLYVDLIPAAEGTAITHSFEILSGGERELLPDDVVFETYGHIDGQVVLTTPKQPKPKKPRAPKGTGDSQLDRLLQQGWEIAGDTPTEVHLARLVNGAERKMVHKKPKKRRR